MADGARALGPVELVERFANGAHLVRIASGRRRGELCLVTGDAAVEVLDLDGAQPWRQVHHGTAATDRARSLLLGRLSPRQRDRFTRTGSFWVLTEPAWVRLGALYDLRVRSRRAPWVERSTCVVTERFGERPIDDLWSELLAWLAVDPHTFLEVGNPQPCTSRPPPPVGRHDLEAWLHDGARTWRQLRDEGLELESAHHAYELAVALERVGRPRWAAHYAARAWEQVRAEAARFTDDEARVLRSHEPLRALDASLGGAAADVA